MRAVRPPRWSHRLSVRSTVKTVHPKGPSFFFLFPPLLFLALLLCGSSRQILSVRFRNAADRKLSAAVSFFLVFFFCFRSDFLLLLLKKKKKIKRRANGIDTFPLGRLFCPICLRRSAKTDRSTVLPPNYASTLAFVVVLIVIRLTKSSSVFVSLVMPLSANETKPGNGFCSAPKMLSPRLIRLHDRFVGRVSHSS